MFGCLCKASLRKEGATQLQKWNDLKSEWISSTSVRKECFPRKFMKISWKSLGRSLLFYSTVKKWAAEFKFNRKRESVEDDGRSGLPKDSMADENVNDVHTLVMCDRRRDLRSITSEGTMSSGCSTINPY